MNPLTGADDTSGQIIVTRFECPTLRSLLTLRLLHVFLRYYVRRDAEGFLGIRLLTDWRDRTILSISLWEDLSSVYTIGNVRRHIFAVRVVRQLRVRTGCGIFSSLGDCQHVMFRGNSRHHTSASTAERTAVNGTDDNRLCRRGQ